ncbi:MAG: mechanosensitive ion channel [Bacteroidales bacterium]|nr:mechanosensitive ion channel [Bacteroidales bacterium]
MDLIGQNLSGATLGLFALYMILVFAFFRIIQPVLRLFPLRRERRSLLLKHLPFVELIIWVVLMGWAIPYLWNDYRLYSLALSMILLMILFWTGWFLLKDLIAGVIFKSHKHFSKNEIITIDNVTGKIISFESRYVVLETLSGKNIHYPYSKLIGFVLSKANPAELIKSYKFKIRTSKENSLVSVMSDIKQDIVNLPWASVKKQAEVHLESEDDHAYTLELIVFSIQKEYLYRIEQYVKNKYEMNDKQPSL